MSGVDTRNIQRDSLFLMANVRVADDEAGSQVKVRNLSAGGMMAEGTASVQRGMRVSIELRNLGWIEGNVAWVQNDRFGIVFEREIDPKIVRTSPGGGETHAPRFTRPSSLLPAFSEDATRLRKI